MLFTIFCFLIFLLYCFSKREENVIIFDGRRIELKNIFDIPVEFCFFNLDKKDSDFLKFVCSYIQQIYLELPDEISLFDKLTMEKISMSKNEFLKVKLFENIISETS